MYAETRARAHVRTHKHTGPGGTVHDGFKGRQHHKVIRITVEGLKSKTTLAEAVVAFKNLLVALWPS